MTVLNLRESAVSAGTGRKRRARILAANVWGSSGYYEAEALERDGSRVFHAGVQMFENHITDDEKWQRPEGDVGKLVGKLSTSAVYEAENPTGEGITKEWPGPGLYSDVEFYESYVSRINEIADDIGLSVRAQGLTEEAERDGRFGPVVVALLSADSVDVVTKAGAGGKLVSIIESHREPAGRPIEKTEKGTQSVTDVTKEDFEAFTKTITEAIAGISSSFAESLSALAPVAPVEVVESASEVKDETKDEVVIDHIAVVEALASNNLPTAAIRDVVESISGGKTLEESIAHQIELREAFLAGNETGTVVLKESGSAKTGIDYALSVLG